METIRSALRYSRRLAVAHESGNYRYGELLASARSLQASLGLEASPVDISGEPPRVAIFADPGPDYVAATWATWLSGCIAVPLCLSHPDDNLRYFLEDSQASKILAGPRYADRLARLGDPFGAETLLAAAAPPSPGVAEGGAGVGAEGGAGAADGFPDPSSRAAVERAVSAAPSSPSSSALIIYTSGTTGNPKGALHTHGGLNAQVETLARAWEVGPRDRVLHVLPLHHTHGIVNALLTPLSVGACVEFAPKFSPSDVWRRLERGGRGGAGGAGVPGGDSDTVSIFMGVPTMYQFLASSADPARRGDAGASFDPTKRAAAESLRLSLAGSMACPAGLHEAWRLLSGKQLLERYGMTETGMILGNPLHGERRVGSVGLPFDGVEVRIDGGEWEASGAGGGDSAGERPPDVPGASGELLVRGRQLFKGYLGKPEATAESFTADGWFRTGDAATLEGSPPYYRLLGRASIDVLKRGGYKMSALDVEAALLRHPGVREAAVFPLPSDDAYGEDIVAAIVPRDAAAATPTLDDLNDFAIAHLAKYQLPTKLCVIPQLERNAMGKVNKKKLRKELFPDKFQ